MQDIKEDKERIILPIVNTNTHIVVVEQVYFQPINDQPIQFESSFVRLIKEDEQPYIRKTSAQINNTLIDKGWLKEKVFYTLLLKNEEDNKKSIKEDDIIPIIFLSVKETNSDKYVIISSVLPKESIRINLDKNTEYFIRSNIKGVKYTSVLFPG